MTLYKQLHFSTPLFFEYALKLRHLDPGIQIMIAPQTFKFVSFKLATWLNGQRQDWLMIDWLIDWLIESFIVGLLSAKLLSLRIDS